MAPGTRGHSPQPTWALSPLLLASIPALCHYRVHGIQAPDATTGSVEVPKRSADSSSSAPPPLSRESIQHQSTSQHPPSTLPPASNPHFINPVNPQLGHTQSYRPRLDPLVMIDHLIGRPNAPWKRTQVCAGFSRESNPPMTDTHPHRSFL